MKSASSEVTERTTIDVVGMLILALSPKMVIAFILVSEKSKSQLLL